MFFDQEWRINRLKRKKVELEATINAFDRMISNFKSVPERLVSKHLARIGRLAVVEEKLYMLTGIHK